MGRGKNEWGPRIGDVKADGIEKKTFNINQNKTNLDKEGREGWGGAGML